VHIRYVEALRVQNFETRLKNREVRLDLITDLLVIAVVANNSNIKELVETVNVFKSMKTLKGSSVLVVTKLKEHCLWLLR
jgi:hypothetical protein